MSIVKNPNAPKSLSDCIEESTNRIVDSIDRLTAAVLASGYRHSLTKIHLNEFLDAYNFFTRHKRRCQIIE